MTSYRFPPLPTVKDILRMYEIRATKKLSQNFILDPRLLDRIARSGGSLEGKHVVEVGPGPGGITRAILGQGAAKCVVIEKDPRFTPSLEMLKDASKGKLDIHMGDVLSFNMAKLFDDSLRRDWKDNPPDIRVLGNLPFNVSTPLLIKWLEAMSERSNIFSYGRVPLVLTFQHEVAVRMVAPPTNPARSRLSVICQNYASVKYLFQISGGAFVPKPDVDVGVVLLTPLAKPYISLPFHTVNHVISTLLHTKRKPLYRCVGRLFPEGFRKPLTALLLKECRLSPDTRALDLKMSDFRLLCQCYHILTKENPSLASYHFRGQDLSKGQPPVYLEAGEEVEDNQVIASTH